MDSVYLVFATLFFTGAGMVLIPLAPARVRAAVCFSFVLLNAGLTAVPAVRALAGNPLDVVVGGIPFFDSIPIRLDALSAWFVLIINFTCINFK